MIGKVVLKFLDIYKNKNIENYESLLHVTFQNIVDDSIFPNFDCSLEHKAYFIDFLVQEFIRIRSVYITKNDTLIEQRLMLRKKLKERVHFLGQ